MACCARSTAWRRSTMSPRPSTACLLAAQRPLRAKKKSSAPKAAKAEDGGRRQDQCQDQRQGRARQEWNQEDWNRQKQLPQRAVPQRKNRKKIQRTEQENKDYQRPTGGQAQNPGEGIGRAGENRENRAPLTAFVHEIAS